MSDPVPGAGAAEDGYPVILNHCGHEQTFTRATRRVVVMDGASVAEVSTLLALELGDRIVASQQGYGVSEVTCRARPAGRGAGTGSAAVGSHGAPSGCLPRGHVVRISAGSRRKGATR